MERYFIKYGIAKITSLEIATLKRDSPELGAGETCVPKVRKIEQGTNNNGLWKIDSVEIETSVPLAVGPGASVIRVALARPSIGAEPPVMINEARVDTSSCAPLRFNACFAKFL